MVRLLTCLPYKWDDLASSREPVVKSQAQWSALKSPELWRKKKVDIWNLLTREPHQFDRFLVSERPSHEGQGRKHLKNSTRRWTLNASHVNTHTLEHMCTHTETERGMKEREGERERRSNIGSSNLGSTLLWWSLQATKVSVSCGERDVWNGLQTREMWFKREQGHCFSIRRSFSTLQGTQLKAFCLSFLVPGDWHLPLLMAICKSN